MYTTKKFLLLAVLLFFGASCNNNNESPRPGPEAVGSAYYLVNNQTDFQLKVVFTTSNALGAKLDSSNVPKDSTIKILQDAIIGVNPKPSDSFKSIKIYKNGNSKTPAFVLSPVKDNRWKIISKNFGKSRYGLTKFSLAVTNNDLSN